MKRKIAVHQSKKEGYAQVEKTKVYCIRCHQQIRYLKHSVVCGCSRKILTHHHDRALKRKSKH